jgi:hypothetical protein
MEVVDKQLVVVVDIQLEVVVDKQLFVDIVHGVRDGRDETLLFLYL